MGDSRYFDKANKKNKQFAIEAVSTSLREVLSAFVTGTPNGIEEVETQTKAEKNNGEGITAWTKKRLGINLRSMKLFDFTNVPTEALKIVPDPERTKKINQRPPMFKYHKKKNLLEVRKLEKDASQKYSYEKLAGTVECALSLKNLGCDL